MRRMQRRGEWKSARKSARSGFRDTGRRILRQNIRSRGWRREDREQSVCRWREPGEQRGSGEKPWLDFSFPGLRKVSGGAVGVGENGEDGIEAAVGDVDAAVNHVEIVGVVYAAPGIDDGSFGIVAHAAGAGLMLPATDAVAGEIAPSLDRAGFLEPSLRSCGHDAGNFQSVRVLVTGELGNRHAPKNLDRGVELHAGIEDL